MKEPFFSLLRTGLGWGENNLKIFPISVAEWKKVWMQAQKQTVCGFVFAGIEKLPAEMQPSKEIMMRMWTYTERIKKTNLIIGVVANEILGWYEAEGLEPTIIKGITSGALYNRPELRSPGENFAHSVKAKNRQYVYYIKLFHYFVLVYPFWKKFIWMSIPKRIGNRLLLILKLK